LVERRNEPEPGAELAWALEAGEVADLEAEQERGGRVDAVEAAQPRDGRPPLALEREPGEPLVDGSERVERGELGRGLVELLPGKPLTVALRRCARLGLDAPLQQQQLRNAVPATHQVGAGLLAGTAEMPRRLDAKGWAR
jgi:hypothetical protein